jgi:RHS repeat-associated protein
MRRDWLIVAAATLVTCATALFATAATAATTERSVYYSYDLAGRQTDARFDSATGADELHNVYDGFGEVTSSTLTMGTFSKTLTSSYDAGGRRTQLVHPDNSYTFSYCYDALSRLTSVGQGTTCTTTPLQGFTYTSAGLPNVRSEGSTGASNVTYGWDDVGRLISQADVFGSSVATKNVNWAFTLNPASEIGQEARTIPNSTSDPYAYGGLLAVNRNYAVNGLNQYTTAGAAAFTYDANGNLTSDGTNTYTYDVENRLVSGTYTSGASTYVTSLTYDPLGRLFEVAQTRNNSTQSDTQFLYDGDALVVEYDNTKAGAPVSNRYVHGSNAAADDPLIWYSGNNLNTLRYLHADHLGSIVAIASSTGTSYATDTYDEYGINGSGNNTAERFGYTGQAWIPELGMYYYKARIYSPTLGRFLQTDPIGHKDQINLYEYVGDDPVDEDDPTGDCTGSNIQQSDGQCMGGGFVQGAGSCTGACTVVQQAAKGAATGAVAGAAIGGAAGGIGGATACSPTGPGALGCAAAGAAAGAEVGTQVGAAAGAILYGGVEAARQIGNTLYARMAGQGNDETSKGSAVPQHRLSISSDRVARNLMSRGFRRFPFKDGSGFRYVRDRIMVAIRNSDSNRVKADVYVNNDLVRRWTFSDSR